VLREPGEIGFMAPRLPVRWIMDSCRVSRVIAFRGHARPQARHAEWSGTPLLRAPRRDGALSNHLRLNSSVSGSTSHCTPSVQTLSTVSWIELIMNAPALKVEQDRMPS
jgi:hypothetical protein